MAHNTPQRHHYVPKFYLSCFTLDKDSDMLAVFNTHTEKSFITNKINIAVEKDFHTVENDVSFEHKIAQLESDWSQVHRKLLQVKKDSLLTSDEKGMYADFLGYQLARTARFREAVAETLHIPIFRLFSDNPTPENKLQIKSIADALLTALSNTQTVSLVSPALLNQLKEARETGIFKQELRPSVESLLTKLTQFTKTEHVKSIDDLAQDKAKIIMQLNWVIAENVTDTPFITCDNPVQVLDYNLLQSSTYAGDNSNTQKSDIDVDFFFRALGRSEWVDDQGHIKPELLLYIPLSPQLALLCSIRGNSQGYATFDDETTIKGFNNLLTFQTEKFLFSSRQDFDYITMHDIANQANGVIKLLLSEIVKRQAFS
jgi:hypothetical protein